MNAPDRGFPVLEYQTRLARAHAHMQASGIDALLLTTEPEIRYFSGYLTRFWESPSRPWFLVVPATSKPIAVIPSIGADLMAQTWISDVRTWRSPDLNDDGVSVLADTLREVVGKSGTLGVAMGQESHLRMPLADFERLKSSLASIEIRDDVDITRNLRMVKSANEIDKITHACRIAGRAFAQVKDFTRVGTPLDDVFRHFQMACLEQGGDWVSYLAGGAGPGGYHDVISPATSKPLLAGDVLMLDTGLVWDGYFCDFDRNFAVGHAEQQTHSCHAKLMEATRAAFDLARPGNTIADLFHAMNGVLGGAKGTGNASRLGHGLGMQLTEWPSIIEEDKTILEVGMVLTLEPCITTENGRIIVHEENIAICENGAEWLSPLASDQLEII